MLFRTFAFVVLSTTLVLPAHADVTFGPYVIPTNGGIDAVTQVEGTPWSQAANGFLDGTGYHGGSFTFSDLIVSSIGILIDYGAADLANEMTFEAHFNDNVLVNGPGADLILVDAAINGPNGYDVSIEGPTGFTDFRSYASDLAVDLGYQNVYFWFDTQNLTMVTSELHATAVDLSDFGFAAGTTVTAFRFRGHAGADLLGAAAIHIDAGTLPTRSTSWGAVKALYR